MNVRVGSAPDSWGVWFPSDPKQVPWQRFLDEVVEAGYEWIELGPFGYLPTDVDVLRKETATRGLRVSGTFVMAHMEDQDAWPALKTQIRTVAEILQSLDARFLVLIDDCYTNLFTGEQLRPERLNNVDWQSLIATAHWAGELAREYGLTLVVHPHADTHIQDEDQIELMLEETDPELVQLCLDTGHHAYRGGDPIAFLAKHSARIPYLHLKSVDAGKRDRTLAGGIPFAQAVAEEMFCEPSRGVVDFPALRDELRRINFDGWAIVEQDMYPAPPDRPLAIARRTRKYIRELGIG